MSEIKTQAVRFDSRNENIKYLSNMHFIKLEQKPISRIRTDIDFNQEEKEEKRSFSSIIALLLFCIFKWLMRATNK